jgi:DNA polymerase-1
MWTKQARLRAMDPCIWLLDASTYIFRAYYSTASRAGGPPVMSTSDGLPTNALLVFTQMLRRLIRRYNPEYMAIVFDHPDPTFRKEKFPAYKANRGETPEDLIPQFPYFRPIAEALGLVCVDCPAFEADDIIATLVRHAQTNQWESVIVSSDKDLYQLLTGGVHMLDEPKRRWVDDSVIDKTFGVHAHLVTQVQGLMGDATDNIPGVPGIGPKRASKLIKTYGTLEQVYTHVSELKGKLRDNLETHKNDAFLSRELATLRLDTPISTALAEYAVQDHDPERVETLFTTLEFHHLLREFRQLDADVLQMPHTVDSPPGNALEPSEPHPAENDHPTTIPDVEDRPVAAPTIQPADKSDTPPSAPSPVQASARTPPAEQLLLPLAGTTPQPLSNAPGS